jgi:thiol-disulfide isomerase/thioredoxin
MRNTIMHTVGIRAVILVLCCFFLLACKKEAEPVVLELDDGNLLKQQDWQGKWVYINYWAEWCKPCAEEIPELNKFAQSTPDALVLGVNFDKVPDPVLLLKQINAMKIKFPVVLNDIQQAFKHPVPQGLPATLVINPDGIVVATLLGPQTEASLAAARKK